MCWPARRAAQMAGSSMPTWKVIAATASFVTPLTVAALDVFGYVAKVEGASMQVTGGWSTGAVDILNKDCRSSISAILTWVPENVKISARPLNNIGN